MPELRAGGSAWSRLPQFDVPPVDWCTRAGAIAAAAVAAPAWRAAFRLGDAVLELASDCDALIGELGDHYGECEIAPGDPQARALPHVRCTVHGLEDGRLALVRFESRPAVAPFDVAIGLLKHPAAEPEYVEGTPLPDGWHPIVHAATGWVAVAARGPELLADLSCTGARLLGRLLVDSVLALQRTLLFAHAASVGIRGSIRRNRRW